MNLFQARQDNRPVRLGHRESVLRDLPLLLRIWTALARSLHSLTQIQIGASTSVQTYASTAAGAQALSMLTVVVCVVGVALTLVVTATSKRTMAETRQAQSGLVASKYNIVICLTVNI